MGLEAKSIYRCDETFGKVAVSRQQLETAATIQAMCLHRNKQGGLRVLYFLAKAKSPTEDPISYKRTQLAAPFTWTAA